MPTTPRARRNPALVLLAAVTGVLALLVSTMGVPSSAGAAPAGAGAAVAPVAPAVAKQRSRVWRAQAALARAQKAFDAGTPAAERPNATMALRNLALLKDALSPTDRRIANKLAGRPDKPASIGDDNILMHYDPNEVGYDVNVAFQQLQYVANTYAASGYRRPKSDKGKGGDKRVDIYLDQLDPGFYGFCTTDERIRPPKFDVWAYCVLDADYAGFPRTPIENFQVTAAHEYFHATQFAYDIAEDQWLLEATATWAEDQLYDTINDNYQYLSRSPITSPSRPIDKFESNRTFHYGVWNFFRFLTERYPTPVGTLPGLILKIWQNADSSKGPRKDKYSTQAIDKALKKNKSSLADEFTLYSAATRYTHQSFSEGAELNYPSKAAAGAAGLPAGSKKSFKTKLDHLTSATYNFANAGGTSQLKIQVRMAPKKAGSRAVAVLYGAGGVVIGVQNIKVNKKGNGKKKVAFDASVTSVDVTLVNASTKYVQCYRRGGNNPISCSGKAVYDNEKAKVTAKAS